MSLELIDNTRFIVEQTITQMSKNSLTFWLRKSWNSFLISTYLYLPPFFYSFIWLENRSYAIMHPSTGYCQGMSDSKSKSYFTPFDWHFLGNSNYLILFFSGQSDSLCHG
jgi:hypothetical protein